MVRVRQSCLLTPNVRIDEAVRRDEHGACILTYLVFRIFVARALRFRPPGL